VVKSRIASSSVSIDGRRVGVVPAESGVPAGQHEVRVERDGFDAVSTRFVVKAGDHKELTLDPVSPPSVLTRWWFWTAAGVIVAAGVATVVALSVERSPREGNFGPGLVRF